MMRIARVGEVADYRRSAGIRHTADRTGVVSGLRCLCIALIAWQLLGTKCFSQQIQLGNLVVEMDRLIDMPPTSSLSIPTLVDFPHDGSGRMIFPELRGRVRMLDNGVYSTFLDMSGEVIQGGSQGLLGLTLHPGYADPLSPGYRKLYTFHSTFDTAPTPDFVNPGPVYNHNVVTEWQVSASDPKVVDITTRRELFRATHPNELHSGGMVTFGPDGYLYTTIGSPTDFFYEGQDNSNLLGTIIRIDPLDPSLTTGSSNAISANGKYRIPDDNPFVSDPTALDEIFAYGVRNPYRMSVDPVSGLLFAGDVGQGAREEVSVIQAGENMGWPYREGSTGYLPPPDPPPAMVDPIAEYNHSDGRSVIGGFVYRGSIPELQGKYIFGEFSFGSGPFSQSFGRLFWIDPFDEMGELKAASEVEIQQLAFGPDTCAMMSSGCRLNITLYGFGVDEDQELYIVGLTGNKTRLYKITSAYVAPDGDYNRDGVVNAADYPLWRDTVGANLGLRPADGDGDGVVHFDDYSEWQANFGAMAGSGADALILVPEPTGLAMVTALAAGFYLSLRRLRIISM